MWPRTAQMGKEPGPFLKQFSRGGGEGGTRPFLLQQLLGKHEDCTGWAQAAVASKWNVTDCKTHVDSFCFSDLQAMKKNALKGNQPFEVAFGERILNGAHTS